MMTHDQSFFEGVCLDDIMHDVIKAVLEFGGRRTATRGTFEELTGVLMCLHDPRARLSRTETRGRPFSALGEFCWYMSGRADLEPIEHYVAEYRKDAVDGVLPGAYGPRLVGDRDGNQLNQVIARLVAKPTSRKAVVRVFDAIDLQTGQRDVPCTCTLQYLIRNDRLEAITYMRSNDVYWGLPHDVFCFTLLQEYLAALLGVGLGSYKHVVGSLHLYERHSEEARAFLAEGFQSTKSPMPDMPQARADDGLRTLLEAETLLREPSVEWDRITTMEKATDDYWGDLIRLLRAFRLYRNERPVAEPESRSVLGVKSEMSTETYHPFIDRLADKLSHA